MLTIFFIGNPTVSKGHVHDIAQIFVTLRNQEESSRLGNHLRRVFQRGHIHIEHIAQAIGCRAYTMSQMQPSFGSLDGMRALAILHLGNGVIVAGIDNLLLLHLRMGDIVYQGPANAATRTGIDKSILRTGVEGILAIDELRMQHYVALLRLRLQIGQTLPSLQVLGTCDTCGSSSSTEVAWLRVIVTLGTEHAINPAILVPSDTHIIDIGGRYHIVGHRDGLVPEAEVVDTIGRLGHSEERLTVGSLHAHYQAVFPLPLDSTRIQRGIHHDALHQVGIILLAEVITPL